VQRTPQRGESCADGTYASLRDDHRGRPGAPLLAAVIAEYRAGEGVTRGQLEDAFLSLCDAHGIRRPRVNCMVAGLLLRFTHRQLTHDASRVAAALRPLRSRASR
jgi:hypothetical protein